MIQTQYYQSNLYNLYNWRSLNITSYLVMDSPTQLVCTYKKTEAILMRVKRKAATNMALVAPLFQISISLCLLQKILMCEIGR